MISSLSKERVRSCEEKKKTRKERNSTNTIEEELSHFSLHEFPAIYSALLSLCYALDPRSLWLNRPCHSFGRHLDEQATAKMREKLQFSRYETLMSNNFRKTAVLKKICIVN